MALPQAFRPRTVANLFKEEETHNVLKTKLNLKEIFIHQMVAWYKELSKSEKSKLTRKQLVRRAILEAHRLRLVHWDIPHNWMDLMKKEVDLILYISKRTKARREARTAALRDAEFLKELTVVPVTPSPVSGRKFIDLTSQPPPEEWERARFFGENPKRYLALHSSKEHTIIYWDYCLEHWKLTPRNNNKTNDEASDKDSSSD